MYRTWKLFRDLSQILEISASSEFLRNMLQKRTEDMLPFMREMAEISPSKFLM